MLSLNYTCYSFLSGAQTDSVSSLSFSFFFVYTRGYSVRAMVQDNF